MPLSSKEKSIIDKKLEDDGLEGMWRSVKASMTKKLPPSASRPLELLDYAIERVVEKNKPKSSIDAMDKVCDILDGQNELMHSMSLSQAKIAEALTPKESLYEGDEDEVLYDEAPSKFASHPFLCLLSMVPLGIPYFIWSFLNRDMRLIITKQKVTLRRGLLRKSVNEIFHQDIRNVKVNQTFFERLIKVGTVEVSSAGSGEVEVVAKGMPRADFIKDIIYKYRNKR